MGRLKTCSVNVYLAIVPTGHKHSRINLAAGVDKGNRLDGPTHGNNEVMELSNSIYTTYRVPLNRRDREGVRMQPTVAAASAAHNGRWFDGASLLHPPIVRVPVKWPACRVRQRGSACPQSCSRSRRRSGCIRITPLQIPEGDGTVESARQEKAPRRLNIET
jgi:hypothetical protein